MAVAFSSIPVWRLDDMPNLENMSERHGMLVPSKFACLRTNLLGTYNQKYLPLPYCWAESPEIPEPPEADPMTNVHCISNPRASDEPPEGAINPCDFPWYAVPAEPLVLDLYYDGAQEGQTYKMAVYVFEYSDGDTTDGDMMKKPNLTLYPFEFTATGKSGVIKEALEVNADEGKTCCCYVDFEECDIGEKTASSGGESEDAG